MNQILTGLQILAGVILLAGIAVAGIIMILAYWSGKFITERRK